MLKRVLFFLLIITFTIACRQDEGTVNCMPQNPVFATYDLNLPGFNALLNPQGYVVLSPDGTNGSQGLILYNTGLVIKAYDRIAPHTCSTLNTTLQVKDGITIVCPADSAQWLLRTGEPLNSQTNGRSPRQFFVQQAGSTLTISN